MKGEKKMRVKAGDLQKLANAFYDNLYVSNIEYGGIGLDPKRPFGNSNVSGDILEIIGWEPEGDDGDGACHASWQIAYADKLYADLIQYLQDEWLLWKFQKEGLEK